MLGSSLELFGWNFVRLEAGTFTPESSGSAAKLPLRATDLTRSKSQRNLSTAEVAKLKSEVMEAENTNKSKSMEKQDAPKSALPGKVHTKASPKASPKGKSAPRPRVRLGRGMAAKLACKQLLQALATPATATSSKTAPKTTKGGATATSSKTARKTNKSKAKAKANPKPKARIFWSFKQNQTNQGKMSFTLTYCF